MVSTTRPPLAIVMGVAGSGKSTIGAMLAQRLGVPFADADDFHPQANIDKQHAGVPLDDADREPWLRAIAAWLDDHRDRGAVITCSALKRRYRDLLRGHDADLAFLHLAGPVEVATQRVTSRPDHFMPASLVDAQYATLEPLQDDECGIVADFTRARDDLVDEFARFLGEPDAPAPGR